MTLKLLWFVKWKVNAMNIFTLCFISICEWNDCLIILVIVYRCNFWHFTACSHFAHHFLLKNPLSFLHWNLIAYRKVIIDNSFFEEIPFILLIKMIYNLLFIWYSTLVFHQTIMHFKILQNTISYSYNSCTLRYYCIWRTIFFFECKIFTLIRVRVLPLDGRSEFYGRFQKKTLPFPRFAILTTILWFCVYGPEFILNVRP